MTAQFCDVSVFQPSNIDWQAYKIWSASGDGISRVALRSSYGRGYIDQHFQAYRTGALDAGIDVILYYHYSYPASNGASSEADWQHQVIGALRPQDQLVLDFEENVDAATAEWAYEWLARQEQNYGKPPMIYASDAYIRERLNDQRLAHFPLWLAAWQFTPDARPVCPPPWSHYTYLQYTDRATIPGIAGTVDANISLGGNIPMSTIPTGWKDENNTLTAPNGISVVLGFRDYILSHNWDAANWPVAAEFGTQQLEISNPSLGDGTQQVFYKTLLGWTKGRGVFEEYVGKEYAVYKEIVKTMQTPPADVIALLTQMSTQIQTLLKQLQGAA